ncbi:hypothetical protein FNV64_53920 [Streptomyces sp. S1A1-7]|nr:hypothetical protein FNV64_53920 [Streptomyces sp. S1A1-7]
MDLQVSGYLLVDPDRVLGIQAELHRWAADDTGRRFNDLFNLVCDPVSAVLSGSGLGGQALSSVLIQASGIRDQVR